VIAAMVFIVLRLLVAAFFLLTAVYGVLNCSPFAFDMFVRPQLFPWLAQFVAWHHVWFAAAYAASLVTIAPALRRQPRIRRSARVLAIAYALVLGAASVWLLVRPYLPTLWSAGQGLPLALLSFVPILWLALVDHLSVGPAWLSRGETGEATGPRRLLVAAIGAAGFLWAAHLIRAIALGERSRGALAWTLTAAWTLTLTSLIFVIVAAAFTAVSAIAARTRAPRRCEYALIVVLAAAGIAEFFRRLVFPTLSLEPRESASVAAVLGLSAAAMWSSLVLRRRVPARHRDASAAELFLTPVWDRTKASAALPLLIAVSCIALHAMTRRDWDFVVQRLIVIVEWTAVFGVMLRITDTVRESRTAIAATLMAAVAVLAMLLGLPRAATALASWTGDPALEPSVALGRYATTESAFRLVGDTLVARRGFDDGYDRYLQRAADYSGAVSITIPSVEYAASPAPADARRPDVFVLVVDSLRRDYLSTFNPAVTFTPNFDRFAAEGFAFRNAFTRHGGTELAMPSIWAGAAVVRKVVAPDFTHMNALEQLVNADHYRMAINEHTAADYLAPATRVTAIDADVPNVDTDLCHNLTGLEAYLDASAADPAPVFGLFRPMNIHILNTMRGGQRSLDGEYPGFFAPYASRVRRLDGCFGDFISYLKQRGRYDRSIIIVTADHGDSLGEDGNWGHAVWLFPEIVRVPLIVHLPSALKAAVTTDLARLAFTTDIAPTLYALLGHTIRDLGPLFGAPLFVPSNAPLIDRRRESFLLTSSYGATFGLLRRGGRLLYVSDLTEWREYAYDLSDPLTATPLVVDDDLRRVSQRLIREKVAEAERFYRVKR
jgi:hypothetical protein